MRPINVVTIFLLLALVGCASRTAMQPGEGAGLDAPAFELPWPVDPPRQASFGVVLTVNGDTPCEASAAATPLPPQMQLPGPPWF